MSGVFKQMQDRDGIVRTDTKVIQLLIREWSLSHTNAITPVNTLLRVFHCCNTLAPNSINESSTLAPLTLFAAQVPIDVVQVLDAAQTAMHGAKGTAITP
eukprot:7206613-Karenia_brevis.AAC.1